MNFFVIWLLGFKYFDFIFQIIELNLDNTIIISSVPYYFINFFLSIAKDLYHPIIIFTMFTVNTDIVVFQLSLNKFLENLKTQETVVLWWNYVKRRECLQQNLWNINNTVWWTLFIYIDIIKRRQIIHHWNSKERSPNFI